MKCINRQLTTACLALALAGAGCSPHPQTTMVANVVSVRDDNKLELPQEAVEEVARSAGVTLEEASLIGVTPGQHGKAELDVLVQKLGTEREQGLMDFVQIVRRNSTASWINVRELASEIVSVLEAEFKDVMADLLTKDEVEELFAQLTAIASSPADNATAPASRRATTGEGARLPASSEKADSPESATVALAQEDRAALQRVLVAMDRLEKSAHKRLQVKRRLRVWVEEQVKNYAFKPAVILTLDVASSHEHPLVITEIAYVDLPGIAPRAFEMRSRDCNEALTACRIVYAYELTDADVERLKKLVGEKLNMQGESFANQIRAYLNEVDVDVEVFAGGSLQTLAMPGKLIRVE